MRHQPHPGLGHQITGDIRIDILRHYHPRAEALQQRRHDLKSADFGFWLLAFGFGWMDI